MKRMILSFVVAALCLQASVYAGVERNWLWSISASIATIANIWCGTVQLFLLIRKDFEGCRK